MANNSEFCSGLNRYHVYSSTVNWKPYVGQKIAFTKEHNNPSDKFAVARKVTMKGMVRVNCCWAHTKRVLSISLVFC